MREWSLDDLCGPAPSADPGAWPADGVIRLPGIIPHAALAAYAERFMVDAADRSGIDGPFHTRADHDAYFDRYDTELAVGYGIGTPYLSVPELRDVAMHRALVPHLDGLFGEPMGLHLNLTGWRSTQRAWHQDQYLNPACVGWWYAAVWIAVDDVAADAGPFEYVPGSHLWPPINQRRMLEALDEDGTDPDWPWHSEDILGPLFDKEIAERGATVEQFTAAAGDVLVWHPNLCHRGSVPTNPRAERRALISHWSVVSHRCDMPTIGQWVNEHANGTYFRLGPVT